MERNLSAGEFGMRIKKIFAIIITTGTFAYSQFPVFPPDDVTHTMDRDQMLQQLGISFPDLPSKLDDPKAPPNAFPSDSTKPENNWTDKAGHTITRSGFGLWNNYDDLPQGYSPGPEAWRTGEYTPINLL